MFSIDSCAFNNVQLFKIASFVIKTIELFVRIIIWLINLAVAHNAIALFNIVLHVILQVVEYVKVVTKI